MDNGGIVPPTSVTVIGLFQGTVSLLTPLLLVLFIGMIIYGGIIWMTAAGEEKNVLKARQIIIAAIVGFLIVVLAPFLVNLILKFLGVPFTVT